MSDDPTLPAPDGPRNGAERRDGEGPTELELEQRHVDRAYDALEAARERALSLRSMVEVGRGGTNQARVEADVIEDTIRDRLAQLELGDVALVFGRIDTDADAFHIGRVAVSDDSQEPLVIDWRAPVAEPFYRATGRTPMGLTRRRHFVTRGRELISLEDELFGEGHLDKEIRGEGALLAALEQARTGQLGDIVGTIQAEQDEIIRSALRGALVVQGGPGTGKTVVALHRAAYLLYTHRFPLEGQGVLVLGPNRLFLRYIQRVLPSLGEAGAELGVLADLVSAHVPPGTGGTADPPLTARTKGDMRMRRMLKRAVRDRERPLREDLVIDFGIQRLRVRVDRSADIVAEARRRFRHHNPGRKLVEDLFFEALTASARREVDPAEVRRRARKLPEVRAALEWMWPVLTPAELLHDLFGSTALIRSAARDQLSPEEIASLHRPRAASVDEVAWSDADLPLIDEADRLLGHRPDQQREHWEARTYGHIVIDEAQDLSPMALRMIGRRSLNGSYTIVGDIAQATSPGAAADWADVLRHLGDDLQPRRADLSIGYRIPAALMSPAIAVLRAAEPELRAPRAVRESGDPPVDAELPDLQDSLAAVVRDEVASLDQGQIAVIVAEERVGEVSDALTAVGIEHARVGQGGRLDQQVAVVPVRLVKGLEVDVAIVVEPAEIVADEDRGLRALYVALTRATKRLILAHRRPLPAVLDGATSSDAGRSDGDQ
ncbi:MAG: ATP-binding domain-containing protein [Actinomycetota bacterium]